MSLIYCAPMSTRLYVDASIYLPIDLGADKPTLLCRSHLLHTVYDGLVSVCVCVCVRCDKLVANDREDGK